MKPFRPSRTAALALARVATLLLCVVWMPRQLQAQGTVVFRTGGGQPLVTFIQTFNLPTSPSLPLWLEFGFATDESVSPERILDSLTVSLQSPVSLNTAILVTTDAGGTVWLPLTPGTILVDPSAVNQVAIPFANVPPVLANASAFNVSVQIPTDFLGGPMNVIFDLYDNQDSVASMAYFTGLAIPEPSPAALILCGALVWWCGRRKR